MLTINNPPGAANSLKNGFEYFEKAQNAHSFNSKVLYCVHILSPIRLQDRRRRDRRVYGRLRGRLRERAVARPPVCLANLVISPDRPILTLCTLTRSALNGSLHGASYRCGQQAPVWAQSLSRPVSLVVTPVIGHWQTSLFCWLLNPFLVPLSFL
jgi:hypothetical protein